MNIGFLSLIFAGVCCAVSAICASKAEDSKNKSISYQRIYKAIMPDEIL